MAQISIDDPTLNKIERTEPKIHVVVEAGLAIASEWHDHVKDLRDYQKEKTCRI